MAATTIARSIYFFRIESTDHSGVAVPFDPNMAFAHLKTLPFSDSGLYRGNGDGSANAVWVDKVTPVSVRYGVVRHEGLPTVENGGQLSPLPIAAGAGLCEPIHAVFFDNGVVGAEFNFHGPRLTGLANYLREKVPANMMPDHLRFGMLLKKDPMGFLNQVATLKVLDIKVKASDLDELKQLDGMNPFASIDAVAQFGKPDTVEVVLRAGRKRGARLAATVDRFVRKMISKNKLGLAESFLIGGTDTVTGRSVTFDLLKENIFAKKQVIVLDARSRAVQTPSAYKVIREAYGEIGRATLEHAPSA
jgi:hypothetical protein